VQTGVRAGKILWVRKIFVQTSPKIFMCGWIHLRYKHNPKNPKLA